MLDIIIQILMVIGVMILIFVGISTVIFLRMYFGYLRSLEHKEDETNINIEE